MSEDGPAADQAPPSPDDPEAASAVTRVAVVTLPPDPSTSESAHPTRADWRYGAAVTLLTRLIFLPLGYAAHWYFSGAKGAPGGLALDVWTHWDAGILLRIAEYGYTPRAGTHLTAYFPAFPLAVRLVAATGVSYVVAGLVVNTVACTVAFSYLSALGRRELGSTGGRRAVLYLALFPTAVFLVAPYTEPLFIAGAIAAFFYARSRQWRFVALPAAVAVGARLLGLALVAGLGVEFLHQRDFRRRQVRAATLALGAGCLPFLAYAAYLWRARGNPLFFVTDERLGWGRHFVGPVAALRTTLNSRLWAYLGSNYVLAMRLEVIAAVAGVGFTAWAVVRRQYGYATFMALTMAALVTSSWYYSIPRALLTLFPIPLLLASFTGRGQHRHDAVIAAFSAVAAFGVVAFTTGAWFF